MATNPKNLTDKEFWDSYDCKLSQESHNGKITPPQKTHDDPPIENGLTKKFRYVDHNTTCKKSVVLIFESLDGKTEAVKFFNVGLEGRNKNYPAGYRGQFNPSKRGNFRKFWMACIGKAPARWCRVHKSMSAAFKDLVFTGSYTVEKDSKGKIYNKLNEIRLYEQGTK